MSDIIDNLDDLSEEELASVNRLIQKFVKRKGDTSKEEVVVETEKPVGRKKPRQRIHDVGEQEDSKKRHGRGRSTPRNARNQRTKTTGRTGRKKAGDKQCRTEEVQLSGQNKFERMREKNQEKNDSKIDRLLWSGKTPTPRPEKFEYVEVQCQGECGLYYDIHPSLVLIDKDTREITYTCDGCSRR